VDIMEKGLTLKQKLWLQHYRATGVATEAARLAGYKCKDYRSFSRIGEQNLGKLGKYLKDYGAKENNEAIANAEEVLEFLTDVMRGNVDEEVLMSQSHCGGNTTIERLRKELSGKDRLKAGELLAKRYRLLTDNVDLKANVEQVQFVLTDEGEEYID